MPLAKKEKLKKPRCELNVQLSARKECAKRKSAWKRSNAPKKRKKLPRKPRESKKRRGRPSAKLGASASTPTIAAVAKVAKAKRSQAMTIMIPITATARAATITQSILAMNTVIQRIPRKKSPMKTMTRSLRRRTTATKTRMALAPTEATALTALPAAEAVVAPAQIARATLTGTSASTMATCSRRSQSGTASLT
jgi:hypothetical protein